MCSAVQLSLSRRLKDFIICFFLHYILPSFVKYINPETDCDVGLLKSRQLSVYFRTLDLLEKLSSPIFQHGGRRVGRPVGTLHRV
jgi:hypothetical protein